MDNWENVQFKKNCEGLIRRLGPGMTLEKITQYESYEQVQETQRRQLMEDLLREQVAKRKLGESYEEYLTTEQKVMAYEMAMNKILLDPQMAQTPVTWAEFRRMIAVAVNDVCGST